MSNQKLQEPEEVGKDNDVEEESVTDFSSSSSSKAPCTDNGIGEDVAADLAADAAKLVAEIDGVIVRTQNWGQTRRGSISSDILQLRLKQEQQQQSVSTTTTASKVSQQQQRRAVQDNMLHLASAQASGRADMLAAKLTLASAHSSSAIHSALSASASSSSSVATGTSDTSTVSAIRSQTIEMNAELLARQKLQELGLDNGIENEIMWEEVKREQHRQ